MSDEKLPRVTEYLPPERYALGKDAATRIPDPFGNETFIDRLFSSWRLNQDRETWKAHAAALDAMRSAVIANRMTIEAVIEYLETAERFAEIKRIREEARAEALHKIEEQKTQSKHERDVAAEKRKEELADAKHRAVTAKQRLDQAETPPRDKNRNPPRQEDPLADFRAKFELRRKVEVECDRLIEEVRAKARARGKSDDDPDVQHEINNLMDHAQQAIEKTYE